MFSRAAQTPDKLSEKSRIPLYFFALGAVLYWAALPPLNLWPLAFVVPIAWAVTIEHPQKLRFRTVYLGAFLFWLASIWWISCPHPATFFGLLALAGYLSVYWPMFFAASRIAVHRFRIPAVPAVPVCWMGAEYLRNHMLGGFSFCSLEHALYLKPTFIQIADISGGYLVGGMIMMVGTAMATRLNDAVLPQAEDAPRQPLGQRRFTVYLALIALFATAFYGSPLKREPEGTSKLRVAALQGDVPVKLDTDETRAVKTYEQFINLTGDAVTQWRDRGEPIDLVVWPETVCPVPNLVAENPADFEKAGWNDEQVDYWRGELDLLKRFVRRLDTPVLVGLSTLDFRGGPEPARLNSALLIDPAPPTNTGGERPGPRYDKVHLVMFGEYIPFSKYLPEDFFIKTLCQEAGRGTGPVAMPLPTGDCAAVNICFESTIPHCVRGQVLTLAEQGHEPKLLINQSNDGWFRFSQQIDQHLATHVFRAVENRRPCVTATNGGFSAIIDCRGRITAIGKRGEAEAVVGEVPLESWTPIYHRVGDWFPLACTVCLIGLLLCGFFKRSKKEPGASSSG